MRITVKAMLTVAVTLTAAGCSSGAPKTTTSAASADVMGQMRKLSQCMRAHCLPNFPDPSGTGSGGGGISLVGTGIDPASPQFKAAQQAYNQIDPHGNGRTLHQLHHSALQHLAQAGRIAPEPQAKSRHQRRR
jgi:hypothetical protein